MSVKKNVHIEIPAHYLKKYSLNLHSVSTHLNFETKKFTFWLRDAPLGELHLYKKIQLSLWKSSRPSKGVLAQSTAGYKYSKSGLSSLSPCALSSAWLLSACDPRRSRGVWLSHWYLLRYPNIWPQSRLWFCFKYMHCGFGMLSMFSQHFHPCFVPGLTLHPLLSANILHKSILLCYQYRNCFQSPRD